MFPTLSVYALQIGFRINYR